MAIKRNKDDFESNLDDLEAQILKGLDGSFEDLLQLSGAVSDEYRQHYQDDIQTLIDEHGSQQDVISDLENEIAGLEGEAERADATIEELQEKIEYLEGSLDHMARERNELEAELKSRDY